MARSRTLAAALIVMAAYAAPAPGQTPSHQHLGAVHFETSCNEAAQAHFDRGMRYQHSFWYRESKASFEKALRADARCAIAYWGIAQSLLANPFNATPPMNLVEGLAAVRKARQVGARTARENDLIAAIAAFYTHFASAARYAVERGDWGAAAQLRPATSKFADADAMTHFARALGAARTSMPDAARADIDKLGELRDRLRAAKDVYWAEQVDIQWQVANAWLLHAQGRPDAALAAMRAAADAEDKTEKAPVTPGPLAPARELYGAMLPERGMAREALAAYEQSMAKEPNRYHGLAGAAKAAAALGDEEKARTYSAKLVALAGGSESDRPELAAAREFLAKR